MHIEVKDFRDGYVEVLREVWNHGAKVSPRGLKTKELLGVQIVLHKPWDALPQGIGRKLHSAIGAVEAAQLIAGEAHPDLMVKVSPSFAQFKDGGIFHGAYGPRVITQREHVVRKLQHDPYDRRALITIWDPQRDNQVGLHDYPCTTVLQFMIRAHKLDMQVYMRSNDAWRGLAYDAFQFTQLQMSIARELRVKPGLYRHFVASLHIYETDYAAIEDLLAHGGAVDSPGSLSLPDLRARGLTVDEARRLLRGLYAPLGEQNDSLDWYEEKLRRYLNAPCG